MAKNGKKNGEGLVTGPVSTKKRTRSAPDKPFMVLALVASEDLGHRELWEELPIPDGIKNTGAALRYIAETETLAAGRYRVVQLCTDKLKTVETIQKVNLVDGPNECAGE